MQYIVYVADKCIENAKKYGLTEKIASLKEEIEESQYIGMLDYFAGSFRKKRFERQQRLMTQERKVAVNEKDYNVIIFGDILIRGGKIYSALCATRSDNKKTLEEIFEGIVSEEALQKYVVKYLKTKEMKEFERPSEEEYGLIYSDNIITSSNENQDFFICESSEWSYEINKEAVKPYLSRIFETLGRIDATNESTAYYCEVEKSKLLIVYCKIDSLKKLFLAALVDDISKVQAAKDLYKKIFNIDDVAEEDLLRCSVRSYPSLLLADESIWFDIENDKEANLALSPEEDKLLQKVGLAEENYRFPLFINGRAGSGKSTILYYVFAGYLEKYIHQCHSIAAKPILLSYSDELVTRSIRSIFSIIKNHHALRVERGPIDSEKVDSICRKCIQPFCRYLKDLLRDAKPHHPLLSTKYIDHAEFRKLWNAKFCNDVKLRELGADLCWHIIRTYIKGGLFGGYLEPDDYQEIHERQKSVSFEKYSMVYNDIWERWYKGLTTGTDAKYHDDQDLVRCILDNGIDISSHSCVFCDEAQDFTRLELNLIFHLSLFTKKNITSDEICRLPFVFAGDPFQTLNPTGFRWESIKSDFYQNIQETFRVPIYKDIKICYQELVKNYRSSQPIVKFCNSVQLYRAHLFGLKDVRPQQAWSTSTSLLPIFYNMEDEISWRDGIHENTDVIIIVPCALGEELEFVANDPYLNTCISIENDVPQNVVSAMRVKGLEFSRVILFGFGKYAPKSFCDQINAKHPNSERRIENEYYLNNLYVAASRPRHVLFIIDSIESKDTFWNRFPNDQNGYDFIKGDKEEHIWIDAIGSFQDGKPSDWNQDYKEDPLVIAERFESQGRMEKSPYFLKTAAQHYLARSQVHKYNLCLGYASRFEGKWQDSATYFEKAGAADDALYSLWIGKEFLLAFELGRRNSQIKTSIIYKLAVCYNKNSINDLCSVLMELREEANLKSDDYVFLLNNSGYEDVVESVLHSLVETNSEIQAHLTRLRAQIESLESLGFYLSVVPKILLYYKVGDLDTAYTLYEENKGQSLDGRYPTIARDYILYCWDKNMTTKFTENEWRIVRDQLAKANASRDQFWKLCIASKSSSIIEEYYNSFKENLSQIDKTKLGVLWIDIEPDKQKMVKLLRNILTSSETGGNKITSLFKFETIRMRYACAIWLIANHFDTDQDSKDHLHFFQEIVGNIDSSYAAILPLQTIYRFMCIVQYLHRDIANFFKSFFIKNDSFNDEQIKTAQHLWMLNQILYIKMSSERGHSKFKHQLMSEQKAYAKKWNLDLRNFKNEEPNVSHNFSDFADLITIFSTESSIGSSDATPLSSLENNKQQIDSGHCTSTVSNKQLNVSNCTEENRQGFAPSSPSLENQNKLNLIIGANDRDMEFSDDLNSANDSQKGEAKMDELGWLREQLKLKTEENKKLQIDINNLHKKNAELYEKYIKILELKNLS